jgi:hypothetical protein
MPRQLFLDLDGVLGDLDGHYFNIFGVPVQVDVFMPPDYWKNVRKHGNFYGTQPLKQDAMELWEGAKQLHLDPIILTGVPRNVPNVAEQKFAWVEKHFGPEAKIICCYSEDKYLHGQFGDVLVDDRLKYAHHWVKMGGVFVHHTSASDSLRQLAPLFASTGKP